MNRRSAIVMILLLAVVVMPMAAQGDQCPEQVQQALSSAAICGGLGRNEACYGNALVSAVDWQGAEVTSFEAPGNRMSVLDVASLTTAPFDSQNLWWGVAVLALQANVPDTLPGQNVTFVVFGDVQLQNDVKPGEVVSPNSLTGTSNGNPNLRAGPGTSFQVIGALQADEPVLMVGRNEAGDWLQIVDRGETRWVAARFITLDGDSTTLDVVPADATPTLYSAPMQAFRITSRPGSAACDEVPEGGMLVQSPQEATVNFLVNGIEMQVGSTALLRYEADKLEVATLAGSVGVKSGEIEQAVEPGFSLTASEDSPPTVPERYDYDSVRGLPVTLLPDTVNVPPPDGTEVSVFDCNFDRGFLSRPIPSDKPIIFSEAFGSPTSQGAALVRQNSIITLTLNGEDVKLWGISDPYQSETSIEASTGRERGSAILQDWWYVLPHPQPGRYQANLRWNNAGRIETFRCGITVAA
jgi:uncharacterized protein YgiM (DUF1202 family)